MKQILYLYSYTLHDIGYLEIFDAVPTLLLSELHMKSLQLRHFDRAAYFNLLMTDTDTDSSHVSTSLPTSTDSTGRSSHHVFSIQSYTGTSLSNEIIHQPGKSVHISMDIPSISFSVYSLQNGIYQELIHSDLQGFHLTFQQDRCQLFSLI